MVRAELVPGVLRECAAAHVRVAVVVSSGFGEGQGSGEQLRAEIKELLSSGSMRVIGPNCEGVFSAPNRMPLTFSPVMEHVDDDGPSQAGELAVVSQSGGLGFALAQWAGEVGLPARYVITTGNELDVGAEEVVAYLLEDAKTRLVVLIFEGVAEPEALIGLSDRAKDLGKTLVLAKLGTSVPGRRAALAHTLHHSGRSGAYEELFGLGQIVRADDLQDVVHVVQAHARSHRLRGRRIAVVGTSGGAGVRVADACHAAGLEVPELSRGTQERLRPFMPGFGSPANPVDLSAQFFFAGGSFAPVIEVLAESNEVDGVVIATSLTSPTRLERDKDALPAVVDRFQLPLLVYSYTRPAEACRKLMESRRLAWYVSSSAVGVALASLAGAPSHDLDMPSS
jgi:acyl-CoA synthetase (NDP forming)